MLKEDSTSTLNAPDKVFVLVIAGSANASLDMRAKLAKELLVPTAALDMEDVSISKSLDTQLPHLIGLELPVLNITSQNGLPLSAKAHNR